MEEWRNEIDYYSEILPDNKQSRKTEEVIEKIKNTVYVEDIFKTIEISFEAAVSFEEIS